MDVGLGPLRAPGAHGFAPPAPGARARPEPLLDEIVVAGAAIFGNDARWSAGLGHAGIVRARVESAAAILQTPNDENPDPLCLDCAPARHGLCARQRYRPLS